MHTALQRSGAHGLQADVEPLADVDFVRVVAARWRPVVVQRHRRCPGSRPDRPEQPHAGYEIGTRTKRSATRVQDTRQLSGTGWDHLGGQLPGTERATTRSRTERGPRPGHAEPPGGAPRD